MNPFWLLCVTLSLAVLFIGTAVGSLLSSAAAWAISRRGDRVQFLQSPGLLFSIRVFPVVLGTALTLGFALPSFLLLEPQRTVEAPESYLIAFALLGFTVVALLTVRYVRLVSLSRETLRKWLLRAEPLAHSFSIPVYRIPSPEALIAVVGIFRPKIFVGRAAAASLTPDELKAAIAHELAHVRSLDNLKQLLLKITRLPGFFVYLSKMDHAWSAGAELLADANALRSGTSAIELSSAIVKVGRLKTISVDASAVATCHLIPSGASSSALALRIQHLHGALEIRSKPAAPQARLSSSIALLAVVISYLLLLPTALPLVHRWLEVLVR